jgi:hypothetical protein
MRAARAYNIAQQNPRTLVESGQPDSDGVLAAYVDVKQSKLYPRLRIELTVVLRSIRYETAGLFAVDCQARGDHEQLGRCFHVFNYEEARRLLILFIEYGSSWLSPDWFEDVPKGDVPNAMDCSE